MKTLRPSSLSRTLALVPPAVLLASQHASAANVFLKIGEIEGESTDDKHPKWIVVDSVQWGVGRAISSPAGGATREASKPSVSEVTLTKQLDKSTPALFLNAVGGSDVIGEVKLELATTSIEGSVVFYRLTLNDVLVSGLSTSAASGGEKPTESISLNFTKIKIEYFVQDAKGGLTPVDPVGFDLSKEVPF